MQAKVHIPERYSHSIRRDEQSRPSRPEAASAEQRRAILAEIIYAVFRKLRPLSASTKVCSGGAVPAMTNSDAWWRKSQACHGNRDARLLWKHVIECSRRGGDSMKECRANQAAQSRGLTTRETCGICGN